MSSGMVVSISIAILTLSPGPVGVAEQAAVKHGLYSHIKHHLMGLDSKVLYPVTESLKSSARESTESQDKLRSKFLKILV